MKKITVFILSLCIGSIISLNVLASNGTTAYPDFTDAASKVMDGVVHIKAKQIIKKQMQQVNPFFPGMPNDLFQQFFGNPYGGKNEPQTEEQVATGSGVIIRNDGYIVTNNHVVADADEIEVTLHDNRMFQAKVIGTDPSTDLAILKIEISDLKSIPYANSDDVKVGQWVLAVGNPFNLNSTVTAGIVSAKARNINIVKDKYAIESFIQTDAAINPGNSGGALCNLNGELVGINTAIASPTGAYSGYGFAIPVNIVKKVVGDIIEFGAVQRAFLGVSIRDVNAELAKQKGLNLSDGIFVEGMLENSAAKKAGVKPGDVIVSADGQRIKSSPELQEIIGKHKPGDIVSVIVNRDGKELTIPITLTGQNGSTDVITKANSDILKTLGIQIEDLSTDELKKLNISSGVKVIQISEGIISKSTDMKVGCIITKIDHQTITDKDNFIDIMKSKQGGVLFECKYEKSNVTYYYGFGL